MGAIKVNSRTQIKSFMTKQQNKIDSWNMNPPNQFFSIEEKQKIGVISMILKMLLINTRDVLYAINSLEREKNTTAIMILYKTFLENTIDIKYSLRFYREFDLEKISKVIDDSENGYLYAKNVRKKANLVFPKNEDSADALIYNYYHETCKTAHPDFEQLYNIIRNKSAVYSIKDIIEFNVNDNIFSKNDFNKSKILKSELVQIIDCSINEIGYEVTSRYKQTDLINFQYQDGLLIPTLTNEGVKYMEMTEAPE